MGYWKIDEIFGMNVIGIEVSRWRHLASDYIFENMNRTCPFWAKSKCHISWVIATFMLGICKMKLKFIDFIRPMGRYKARVWSEIKPLFKSIEGFSNSIQATLKRPSHTLYLSLPSKRCIESLPRLAPIFLFLIRFSLDCVHTHECLFTISFSMYRLFSRIVQFPCSKCSVHCNFWFVVSRSLSLSRCVY